MFNDLQLNCLFGTDELYIFQDLEEGNLHFLSDEDDFRQRVKQLEKRGVHFSRAFSMDRDTLDAYGFRGGVLMVFNIDRTRNENVENASSYVGMSFDYDCTEDQFLVAKVIL